MFRSKSKASKLDAEGLWTYAMRVLSVRPHSGAELREKLQRRAESKEVTAEVLAKLQHYGYLDDEKMAESYATGRRDNQMHGKFRVLRDLHQRRITSRVAREAVEAVYKDTDEKQLVEQFLTRKYRNVSLPEHLADPKKLAAAYRRLRYAGFSSSAVVQVLKRYSQQADELEDSDSES